MTAITHIYILSAAEIMTINHRSVTAVDNYMKEKQDAGSDSEKWLRLNIHARINKAAEISPVYVFLKMTDED